MTTPTTTPAQPAGWYPVRCPGWCAGRHEPILALPDSPAGYPPDDTAELVFHARDLTAPEATAGGLVVSLAVEETHPASDCDTPGHPRVFVWLPRDHDCEGTSPAQLRQWASVLTGAADTADELLNGDPQ